LLPLNVGIVRRVALKEKEAGIGICNAKNECRYGKA